MKDPIEIAREWESLSASYPSITRDAVTEAAFDVLAPMMTSTDRRWPILSMKSDVSPKELWALAQEIALAVGRCAVDTTSFVSCPET